MHDHGEQAAAKSGKPVGLLVGNPNVGKSALFGRLTGRYAIVSNYPGTTIEITSADLALPDDTVVHLIDTPGVNGLLPFSEDEQVTQRIILERDPVVMVQVADTKNLVRTFALTLQLLESNVPLVLALNMSDEASRAGIVVDEEEVRRRLGIDVVATSAPEGSGVGQLKKLMTRARPAPHLPLYGPVIGDAVERIAERLDRHPATNRLLAVLLLGGDPYLPARLRQEYPPETADAVEEIVRATQEQFPRPLSVVMAAARDKVAQRLAAEVTTRPSRGGGSLAWRLGVWTRQPLTGLPFFLLAIFLLYEIVGRFAAGTLVDFMENTVFGGFVNPWATRLLAWVPSDFVRDLFVGPFGLITMGITYAVAIVLPIVGTFFFCFGFLEDSGYLPRLAIMSNRLFRRIGLNGKAILPMVLGLGCDTMATLTARILETRKERLIVTVLLALGIPCSAQLGVMLAIMASMSAAAVATMVGVILSQLILVGWLASRILPGEGSDFIMEIPPMRWPRLGNLAVKSWLRVEWFLKEAVPLFLVGTGILFLADRFGVLQFLHRLAAPVVVRWLGLPAESATVFIMGFFRRDYGAAGLLKMAEAGTIDPTQMVVALVVITLFIPCIANFLVIVKEQGARRGAAIAGFIFPFALLVGGILNWVLRVLGIRF